MFPVPKGLWVLVLVVVERTVGIDQVDRADLAFEIGEQFLDTSR